MAKQTWNNPIDKTVDWGGDATTGGLPVSGEMVQRFIKETFSQRAGVFYYDNTNNRYLVFADAEARDEYLLDPTQTELVLGTFDAPYNYSAEINLTSAAYNAVFLGSTGNYIDFTFDIKNKQGASTGENVTVTYTFIRNAVRKTVTETRKFGDTVHFNIDKYLGEGTNTIMVGIIGQTSLAATTAAITYQVVNLTIEDSFDISKSYNLTSGSQLLEVPFTVSGFGTKVVEWYIDGEVLPFVKAEDEVVDVIATRTKYITLSNLQQGTHSLQMRAYTVVNGEKFYTDTLYRDIIVYTGVNTDMIVAVALTIPNTHGVIGAEESVAIYDMVQYVPYTIRFATYSPTNAANTEVTITFDGEEKGMVSSNNGTENEFVLTSMSSGSKTLNISAATFSKDIPVEVAQTDMDIQEIQSGLVLDFSAVGKSNNSLDRDYWAFGSYMGTFSGFNWNNSSGWVNGRLEMNAGSSFGINYAPLEGKPTTTGKTIEIEWSTKNVINDDAVICDLRNESGVGILITATKVSLTSANGVAIETEYKSGENVRVAFVINKASGVTNQHLSFIYANGIVSRGETWAASDSYTSNKQILFTATEEAEISLKAIRIYDAALSSDNILNNYILYRDTIAEMMEVYDRNDVYEDGTVTFSPEKMMGRLPVMIVTGDIPTLENTSDKDTQIVVDIDYYNMQDVSRSFTMKNAAMRPQGTSSMGYPKKNFRIYTEKIANTKLYDANGKEVSDKLYSFKVGAQPVNCWCLKADYAESSGTHNTGIARLWNEALYNAQIDGEYKLRTEAQKKAAEVDYPYDVRTTIDGFPILLFYRQSVEDDLIFIGKYNFNNDKSTESVFGFEGIPNFDNSKMQCWEVLNNGNALALFTTADGFDSGWSEAFESRYPDTKTPYTGDLKAFCEWMSTVSEENFATEKWEHLDVYKMAAYWCYLMRHAGADQFVKNAMFTSEDGIKWYYILYDNDTINGLINTGDIRIKPTDGRQTVDESGSYVFAGHDSRLWNMLEADVEFNEIVSAVDNALYSAGISYVNTIRIFDEEQADKWVEKVYNQDAQYKYIGPYNEKGINNLFMLQGKRDLHRKWWLAKRFSIYDAKYVSGTYKSQAVEIKCLNGTEAGQQFTIVAGYPIDYGYGINNVPRSFGIALEVGESHTFTTEEVINLGDPLRIYGAPNIAEIDFSQMADRLAVVTIANVYDENLGTKLRKLVLGNSDMTNTEVTEISGLKQALSLEELDVQGMTKMLSLDLSNHSYFKTLKAFGSGVSSVTFAKGAPVEGLELPSSMRVLNLNQLPYLASDNIAFEDIASLAIMNVTACPNVSNDFDFVYNWYINKTTDNKDCSLIMDNIDWEDVDVEQLIELTQLGTLNLKGVVKVNDITLEQVESLIGIFGEGAFDKNSEFFIDAPPVSFVTGRNEILEGDSEQYNVIVFGAEVEKISWTVISGGNSFVNLNEQSGLLQVTEGYGNGTLVIRVTIITDKGTSTVDTSVVVKQRVYPTQSQTSIVGDSSLGSELTLFELEYSISGITGAMSAVWTLEGVEGYAEIESFTDTSCVVKKIQEAISVVSGTLKCSLTKKNTGANLFSVTKELRVVNENIAETDAGICKSLYSAGLCANETFVTKDEARLITAEQLQPGSSASTSVFYANKRLIKSFNGFKYFTGITFVPKYLFDNCTNLTEIDLPSTITEIKDYAFQECQKLQRIYIPSSVTYIGYYAFYIYYSRTHSLKYVDIDDLQSWCSIEYYSANSCPFALAPNDGVSAYLRINGSVIKELNLPNDFTVGRFAFAYQGIEKVSFGVSTVLTNQSFGYMYALKQVVLPEGLQEITPSLFYTCTALESIDIPESVHTINGGAFIYCENLKSITGGEGVSSIQLNGGTDPFFNISKEVTIAPECTFSLVWCSVNGNYISIKGAGNTSYKPMSFGIHTVLNGNCDFTTASNNYFEGEVIYKTLTISHTGKLEDVADRVKIHSHNLKLTTNRSDAQFEISYTDVDSGEASSMIVTGGGTYPIPAKDGTTLIVSPVTQYEGYMATAVTITATINSNAWTATINYIEKTDIYIQHIDGTLYSVDDWRSAGYANSQANGVAVVSENTSFVIAKDKFAGAWGGYVIDISSAITLKTTIAEAVLDFDGKGNTTKVIEALSGKTDQYGVVGAPAAEACANYTFPNGKIGYLGSAGQWQRIIDNSSTIMAALAYIGVNHYINVTSNRFWTSTPQSTDGTVWGYRGGSTSLLYIARYFTGYYAIPFTDIE